MKRAKDYALVDKDWINSYEGKVLSMEHIIAIGEGIKSTANKSSRGQPIHKTFSKDMPAEEVIENYTDWNQSSTEELRRIFNSPRNAARFSSYSISNMADNWLPNPALTVDEIKRLSEGKLKLLEEMLKELKELKPIAKPSRFYLLMKHPIIVAIVTTVALAVLKIIYYSILGYKLQEIPIP